MIEQTSEALRAWFRRVEPIYPELFNTAHAICGNYDQAEYALRCAILEVWAQNAEGGMGFREKLRSAVRSEAMEVTLSSDKTGVEFTWKGFNPSGGALSRQASAERIETQRLLMLRHGVGLNPGRIAALTGQRASQVRTTLDRFEARCRRAMSSQDRSRFGALFGHAARQQLASRAGIPHPATVYRAFESEAAGMRVSEHRVSRVVYHLLALVMALICAFLFWLFAVMVQAPDIEPDAAPAAAATADVFAPEGRAETKAAMATVPMP